MQIVITESSFSASARDEAIALVAEAGAEGIELVFSDDRAAGELDNADRMEAVAALARDAGVGVPSVALTANMLTDGLICQSDATAPAVEQVRMALHGAVHLGAEVLQLPFGRKSAIEREGELIFACDRLADLGEEAEALGVTLGVGSKLSIDQKVYLIDHTGGVGVRHDYDVGGCYSRKLDPATEIRDLGAGRICQVHFRDIIVREGQPPAPAGRLGDGQVDFPAVMRSLSAIGYDGCICLCAEGGGDALDLAKHNVAYVRNLLAE